MRAAAEGEAAGGLTIAALLAAVRRRLADAGVETPDGDARRLVAGCLGLDAAALFLKAGERVEAARARDVEAFAARRAGGEPVHRILGHRAFYAHDFSLSPQTLEPRPETETLVDLARPSVEAVLSERGACLMVDVGTGTGAIAVTLLALYPRLSAVALDISEAALSTAVRNAADAGVAHRFMPVASDYLSALTGPFDLIVSNPPYIRTAEIATLTREVRDFDPHPALDGGADGLDAYRRIAREAPALLSPRGRVLVEIGQGQASDVVDLFRRQRLVLAASANDLSGIGRALRFDADIAG